MLGFPRAQRPLTDSPRGLTSSNRRRHYRFDCTVVMCRLHVFPPSAVRLPNGKKLSQTPVKMLLRIVDDSPPEDALANLFSPAVGVDDVSEVRQVFANVSGP